MKYFSVVRIHNMNPKYLANNSAIKSCFNFLLSLSRCGVIVKVSISKIFVEIKLYVKDNFFKKKYLL